MKKLLVLLAALLTFPIAGEQLSDYEICCHESVKIDGDLSDWKGVPFKRIAGERFSSDPLRYKGVADAALSLAIAWNNAENTFVLAGRIYDESVKDNDKIEFSISAQETNFGHWKNLKFTLNSTPELKVAPLNKKAKVTATPDQIKFAAKTKNGIRQFEMHIPAGLIQELDPENMESLHVKLRMIDNDARRIYAHMMSWQESVSIRKDVPAVNPENGLIHVILPNVVVKNKIPRRIEFSGSTLPVMFNGQKAELRQEGEIFVLEQELDLSKPPDGVTMCPVTITTAKNQTFQKVVSFLYLGNTVNKVITDTLDRLEKADLPELAQRDPFKASAYFSIVSALEWFKWGVEQRKPHAIQRTAEEIEARFAAIEGGKLPETGIYSLLNLTRDPEAQLVVEFFRERKELYPYPGAIALHFGSMNLVNALFYEYKTAEEAQAYLAGLKKEKRLRIRGTAEDPEYDIPQVVVEPDKTELVSPITGTLYFAKGNLVFQIPYVNRDAADRLAAIIRNGKPATIEDREAIRKLIIQTTKRTPRKLSLPEGIEVFCGDNHSHTFLSDGRPTPLTVTAEALYIGLDYHLLTDHGVFETAYAYRNNTVKKFKLNYPVGIGVEINSRWGHMNVYPVPPEGGYTFGPTFEKMLDAAHSIKGAIIQWNHPDTEYSRLPEYLENGIQETDLDAWEHYPPHYTKWKKEGKLPVLTGGTDTHNGTFHMPERSVMFIPSADCYDIAAGVKNGKIVMLDPWNGAYTITRNMKNKSRWDSDLFFYGADDMIQLAVDVLADPDYLVRVKKKRIAEYLKNVDVRGLINSSDAYETVK